VWAAQLELDDNSAQLDLRGAVEVEDGAGMVRVGATHPNHADA
jgi:hypothetical protein